MKVDHVFGGSIYLISNFGVARNPIFKEQGDIDFFKENIDKYLGELCDIYAYAHERNQFQYLIKIKDRSILENYYFRKQASQEKNVSHNLYDNKSLIAPESYLIISQEVSNCLNSYAKKFNFKYSRKGGLFGDRYQKVLVESEQEMEVWIDRLNKLEELIIFSENWQVEDDEEFFNENGECSSKIYYEDIREKSGECSLSNFSDTVK